MNRLNMTRVAAGGAVLLGLLLALQAGAQGQSGGAKPSGGAGNASGMGNMAIGVDRSWPREVEAPSSLPQDKAFGVKGDDASTKKAANAKDKSTAEADCAKAKAAIAAAGTGGATGKGQGGAAGAEGRAKAAEAACSGINAEVSTSAGQSTEAPGQTGVTGQAQAILRADERAAEGLEKKSGTPASDKKPEQEPPQ